MKNKAIKLLAFATSVILLVTQCSVIFGVLAAGTNYYGLFNDEKSDGGFEYGSWEVVSSMSTAKNPSKYAQTSAEKNRGGKSASFTFGNKKSETIAIHMTFESLDEIDAVEDYCWTAYVKTSSDFKGKFNLAIKDSGKLNVTGLKNKKGTDKVAVYDSQKNGKPTAWKRMDTSASAYGDTALKTFLTGKTSIDVVLTVTGTTGTVWIDDIDFKAVSTLNDPEEVDHGDNTGSMGGAYSGMFDDSSSDGGFENNSWIKSNTSSDAVNTSYATDRYVRNTGRRSGQFSFADNKKQTVKIHTDFFDLSEIDLTQNYCWTAYIKTDKEFDGTVSAKLCAPNEFDGSGIRNSRFTDECVLFDAASMQAHAAWKSFNTAEQYYSAAALAALINENAEVKKQGKVSLVITVTAAAGKVWIDDLDLKSRAYAVGDDDAVESGDYSGMFDDKSSNGGFEHGMWEELSSVTTAAVPSRANIDTAVKNSGSRSLTLNFANEKSETFAFRMNFKDISEISTDSDYFFKAFARSAAGFDGKVTLSVTAHNNLSAIMRDKAGQSETVIFDGEINGSSAAFAGFSTITNRYNAADIASFLSRTDVKNDGIDVVLRVTAATGIIWLDDIDFINYNNTVKGVCLEPADAAYTVDDGDYTGFFDSDSANGGFEYGVWALDKEKSLVQMPSAYYTDTENKNSGKRSLAVEFKNSAEEKFVFKMTAYNAAALTDDDYCLAAALKTSADFKGSASLRITKHNNYGSALINKDGSAENKIIKNAVYGSFGSVDTSFAPFSAESIRNFKNAAATDGAFDVYLTVTAEAGTIWFDDIDLVSKTKLDEDKNKPVEGAVYDGIIFNGGFENGAWQLANPDYHSVTVETDNTYNNSLKSLKIVSSAATGYEGALKLFGHTAAGEAAKLDKNSEYCFTIKYRTEGRFTGSVYAEIKNGGEDVTYNFSKQLYLLNNENTERSEWGELTTVPFKVTGDDISVTLFIDGVGTLYIDDADITKSAEDGNLIKNGGFEYGIWGVNASAGTEVGIDRTVTHGSPAAMYITGNGSRAFITPEAVLGINPAESYKLTMSLKTVGMKYGGVFVTVLLINEATQRTQWAVWRESENLISTGGTADWRSFSAVVTDMPDWADRLVVYINTESTGTLYIDNVRLTNDVKPEDFDVTQPDVEGAVYDGNIYNGGFEAGIWQVSKVNDQIITLDTENTYNNSKAALKVEMTKRYGANKALAFESYTVTDAKNQFDTSKQYCVGLQLKSSEDFVGSVYAQVKQGGEYKWYNWETELHFLGTTHQGAAGYTKWTKLTTPAFDVTAEDISIKLYVDGIGTVWIDDVSIIPDPQADNMLINGGFENGIWSTWGSDDDPAEKVELVSDVTDGSAKAGKITSASDEGNVFMVTAHKSNFDPKKQYKLSLSLKTEGVKMDGVYVSILQWHTSKETGVQTNSWLLVYGQEKIIKTGGTTDWETYSVNVSKFHKDFDSFVLYVFLTGSGTVWVDNVSLIEKKVEDVPAGTVGSDTPEGELEPLTAVHLYSSDEMGDIYFTTDGSDPRKSSTALLYDDNYGVIITEDTKIKACVKSEDAGTGEVFEFNYTCPKGMVEKDKLWKNVRVNGTASLDSAVKKVGSNSIKIIGNGGKTSVSTGHMVFDSNFDYKLDFWVKTEGMVSPDTAYVSVFLGASYATEVYDGDLTKGAYFINPTKMVEIGQNQDWKHYELTIDGMYGGYSTLNITAGINNDVGTMWIDGVNLVALQYEKHPLKVGGDDVRLGNIYDESTLSLFTITQGFILNNAAKNIETGKLKYKVYNDANPEKTISTGDLEVAVRGSSATSYSIDLSMVAEYGTYTVEFTMENASGASYKAGTLAVSRVMDNSDILDGGMFGLCTNIYGETHYTTEFSDRILENFASIGAGMTRIDMDWEKIEPSEGVFKISERDEKIVDYSVARGIQPMFILNAHYWPDFYSYEGTSGFPVTEKQIDQFIEYVKYLVSYFKGRVYYYELFNETNYMPYSYIDGTRYTVLLKRVYAAIKEIDPEIKLVGGATSTFGYKFAEEVFKAGGADYMDYYSFHPYILPNSPESVDWIENVEELHNMAVKYGARDLRFMITEIGWSAVDTVNGVTEQQKMNYMVRAFAWAKSVGYVDRILIYHSNSNGNKYYTESEWGVFGSAVAGNADSVSSSARPAAVGLAAFENITHGSKFAASENLAKGLYAHKYTKPDGKTLYLLWTNDKESYADITVSGGSAKVYDTYGNLLQTDYDGNTFSTDVGSKMIYVVLKKGESIEKAVLKEKSPQKPDNNGGISADDGKSDYDGDNGGATPAEEEQNGTDTVIRRRKIIKKVIKGNGGAEETNPLIIAAIIAAAVIAAGGAALITVLIVKKRRKRKIQ